MSLRCCLTGSYPPIHDESIMSFDLPEETREETIRAGIARAVNGKEIP